MNESAPTESIALRATCAGCPSLNFSRILAAGFYGCSRTGLIVPHGVDMGTRVVTFRRVPTECPLPDDVVVKSEQAQPECLWVDMPVPDAAGLAQPKTPDESA